MPNGRRRPHALQSGHRIWYNVNVRGEAEALTIAGMTLGLVRIRPLRNAYSVNLYFASPIFDWANLVPRFFEVIYASLGTQIPVTLNELSTPARSNAGECIARYNVFGGPSSISLYLDRVAADFPALNPGDYPLVQLLLRTVHDGLATNFPNLVAKRLESASSEHVEVLPPGTAGEILQPYCIASVEEDFKPNAINEPGIKFTLKSVTAPSWQYAILIEKSILHAGGLFISQQLKLGELDTLSSFEQKVMFGTNLEHRLLGSLGLEREHVAGA
jgi:hypothetical protein